MSQPEYNAPGKGVWELEQTHFTRPATRWILDTVHALSRGFGEGTKRYGLLLDTLVMRPVNDFIYGQFRPVGAPEGAKGPPPRLIFSLLTRLHPEIRRRVAAAPEVFAKKLWHEDMKRWDEHYKPDSIARNSRLQRVEVEKLGDAELIEHLEQVLENQIEMVYRHHIFTIPSGFPVAHFLNEAQTLTGMPSGALLVLLKGSTPVSRGVGADELAEVSRALTESGITFDRIRDQPAREALAQLRARPDAVGAAVEQFVDKVGYRAVLGYDVSEKFGLEMPEVLVRSMFSAQTKDEAQARAQAKRLDEVRSKVPQAERPRFDALLEEARFINRLRDERGIFNDLWGAGLARRALLEAGRRLVANGVLPTAELAVSASHGELVGLLQGAKEPSAAELSRRQTWRQTKTTADAPPYLGGTPSGPPPADWLPARARPNARVVETMIREIFEVSNRKAADKTVEGLAVHPGVYDGPARVVRGPEDFSRIQQGDVLVTVTTGPAFNVVLPLLGGIVTDRGGQLSHAAIVAREYGIPAVVGTRTATTTFPDDARVRVDGDQGRVSLLQ